MKLTLAQQDIYSEHLMYPDAPIHNIGAAIAIDGKIDFALLDKAYQSLINQHDSYRSYVVVKSDEVAMKMHEKFNSPLKFIDFSAENKPKEVAEKFMTDDFKKTFQLGKDDTLHTFIFLKIGESFGYLYSKYHHIITDGWGTSLMFQRLVANYNELVEKNSIDTVYPYTYKEYVQSDLDYKNSKDYLEDAAYWKERFKILPENTLHKVYPNEDITKSKREALYINRKVYNEIIAICKEKRVTTFHFILGILYAYFSKRFQKQQIGIGIPVLNRKSAKFKKTVGLFMGVTPLLMEVNLENTFEELLASIRQQLRSDYRHQQFPLGKLINELGIAGEKRKLFDIMLSYEKQDYSHHFNNTKTTVIPMTHESERVGLAIYIREFDASEDVKIDFDYNINYFDETDIKLVVSHFNELIHAVLENPSKILDSYDYMSSAEKHTIVHTFNDTMAAFDLSKTMVSTIKATAKNQPQKIAVKDHVKSYTYHEILEKTDQIAQFLQETLEDHRTPVAVLMERSSDLVIILLAIIKSGRAFIPLDPNFPKERLEFIISHSKVRTLIGEKEMLETLDADVRFLSVDILENLPNQSKSLPEIHPTDTAYIIYTSGSTGTPKGVEIGHESLLNFLLSMKEQPKVTTDDVLYSVTTQSFDISILEFFLPLVAGATLYIADKNTLQNPTAVINELQVSGSTIIQGTPSFYQMLYNAGWQGNKNLKVLCGGDLLPEMLAQKLVETNASLWNMYGPTETTIWSSIKKIEVAKQASTIGKPIHNTHFYILDDHQKLLPIHTEGKLYIGGKGLAKGYYLNTVLTREKFIPNPFHSHEKIYDTGDLGKWNSNGEMEFLGRNDQQVKIRGFRIELGDIETQLNHHEAIKESVVIAKKDELQNAFLIAYIIPKDKNIDSKEIIKYLQKKLPNYMVPYTIISLNEFPLTFNKKVDRKQLAQRKIIQSTNKEQQLKAQNGTQKKLYTFYQKALELETNFSITDSFFALGGHSLNAMRLIGNIEEVFGYRLTLKKLFDMPDILSLSEYLKGIDTNTIKRKEILPLGEKKSYYPVTFPQYSIWLASLTSEKSIAYNMSGAYTILGEIDVEIMQQVFDEVIARYEILRTNFLEIEAKPYQKIKNANEITFQINKRQVTATAYEEELKTCVNTEFDLENDVLLKAILFQIEDGKDKFVFITHHIILDGWSLELLIKEVTDRYRAIVHNEKLDLIPLNYQFKDYVQWQNELREENETINKTFWKSYMDHYRWEALVPYDRERSENNYAGDFYLFELEKDFLNTIKSTAVKNNITLHTLLMASFHVLLNKLYGLTDICVGTINSGRTVAGLNHHIGMFVKTLPLRSQIDPEISFLEFAQNMHENLLAIDEHQDVPQEILNTLRYEVILVLQNETFNYGKVEVTNTLTFEVSPASAQYNRLPLNIDFAMVNDTLRASIQYDSSKYDQETLEMLMLKYEKLLLEITTEINQLIRTIDIDLAFEKKELIDIDFNF